jgi:hypothetical protein
VVSAVSADGKILVTIAAMQWHFWTERLYLMSCRFAGYVMLNVADDAAMLALVFC